MSLLTEDQTLLEVREWRSRVEKEYAELKHLSFLEQERIMRERINEVLRQEGRKEIPEPKSSS